MGIRILIADRQDMFREVLRRLLENENDFVVVGETSDGEQLLGLIAQLRPDVLLLDLRLNKCSGLELLRRILSLDAETRPILLTDEHDTNDLVELLRSGIRGLVWKSEPPAQLFKSIRSVAEGEYWITRSSIGKLVENLRSLAVKVEQNAQERTRTLSPQQQQIVDAIASGCSNKDIARELSISERTVKYHLTRIFGKLGVTGRTQLARFALKSNS
ncbi:MAG: response regulator transcription factor [Acidobacteriota bacterium]|nr:response regulator transcription factor [Acidobacteriota bacterium]